MLGALDVKLDKDLLSSAPLVALEDVGEGGFFSRTWDRVMMFFTGGGETEVKAEAKDAKAQ